MAERWVKVAAASDETDALLMDGLLNDVGIPSLLEEAKQVLQDTTGLGSYAP
jgi:hypothetical protein